MSSIKYIFSIISWLLLVGIVHVSHGALTPADEVALLAKHNELRRLSAKGSTVNKDGVAQPAAADMIELVWDAGLASQSQAWADQCKLEHSQNQFEDAAVGENLAFGYTNVVEGVQAWYDEIKEFNVPSYSTYTFEKSTGHYTQVVWAKSERVGCGYQDCPSISYKNMLVCQYIVAGNLIGSPIYEEGAACSKCPTTHSQCNDGLCSKGAAGATTVAPGVTPAGTTIAGGTTAGGAMPPGTRPDDDDAKITVTIEPALDQHPNCCQWAKNGECENIPRFIRPMCQRSCGTQGCLQEVADKCPQLKKPDFSACTLPQPQTAAIPFFQPSLLPIELQTGCVDEASSCTVLAHSGNCNKGRQMDKVRKRCRKSCGLCS